MFNNWLVVTQGFPGTSTEKSVTEPASSTTDSIKKDNNEDAINMEPVSFFLKIKNGSN